MTNSIPIFKFLTLKIGDLVFTGTPKDVGYLKAKEKLEVYIKEEKLLELGVK